MSKRMMSTTVIVDLDQLTLDSSMTVCVERDDQCAIGWSPAGHMLEYIFDISTSSVVDVILHVADAAAYSRCSRRFRLHFDQWSR